MQHETLFKNACRMWQENAREIENLTRDVSEAEYAAVFEAIRDCKGRVATMGMGTSSVAARKIAHMLCVANVPAYFVSPGDAAHGAFGAVQEGDVLIMLSKGGGTEELVNLIDSVKGKRLKLIVVTHGADSPLARAADIVLRLQVKESDHLHRLPTASILAILSIFDAIADELTQCSQFSEEIFYLNHNHGAMGALLKDKLK